MKPRIGKRLSNHFARRLLGRYFSSPLMICSFAIVLANPVSADLSSARMPPLRSDCELRVAHEFVGRQIKVVRRGPLPYAAGCIVNRAMAWAKIAALKGALVDERHAAEMRANTDNDKPFGFLHPRFVGGRVAELA